MNKRRIAIGVGKALAVTAILVWSLVPIALMLLSSLKPGQEIFAVPPKLFFVPTLAHYADLWTKWERFFAAWSTARS